MCWQGCSMRWNSYPLSHLCVCARSCVSFTSRFNHQLSQKCADLCLCECLCACVRSPLQPPVKCVYPVSNLFIFHTIYAVDVSICTWRKPVSVSCRHGDSRDWSFEVMMSSHWSPLSFPRSQRKGNALPARPIEWNTHRCHRAGSTRSLPSFHSSSPTGSNTATGSNTYAWNLN